MQGRDGIARDQAGAIRLRIVYVWDSEYPWDVRTEKVCRALVDAGHEVHIAARNRAWRAETEALPEGTVHRMKPWRLVGRRLDGLLGFPAFFSPRWRSHIASVLRRARADIVIVRDLPLCPTTIHVARRTGIPVVLDMAEHYAAIMRELWTSGRNGPFDFLVRNPRAVERVERYCIARVQHILTVAEESSARLERIGVPADRLSVVGNTPGRARAEQISRASTPRGGSQPIEVVYLGLLEKSRGIIELMDACRILAHGGLAVRATIIGSGRDEEIFRQHARDAGLTSDLVTFAGFIPYNEAIQRVAVADIGVLPIHVNDHLNTTLPNKLFDYMSVGIPVITSDSAASARVVKETDCGEVFRAGDTNDLVAAVLRLRDPEVRSQKGNAGLAAVLSRYNWENDARVLLTTIQRVARE